VESATHLLGKVEMCRTLLPNANLLIYSSLQREALASSTIEGTIASPRELVLYQASQHSEREAVREVANYGEALTWGYEQLQKRPIGEVLIRGLHARLLSGVRGHTRAGAFKDQQNYIGTRSTDRIEDAVFVPPPPEAVSDQIASLERYINMPNEDARVVQCALVHYQFETIHPFHDGNGRVGRLLIILQMIQLGLLSAPLIYPSVYFERRREEYYQKLQNVRDEGRWDEWVHFFAKGISEQCSETISFTQTILDLRVHMQQEIGNVRRRASLNAVLDAFFQDPVLSLAEISGTAHLSRNAAQQALDELARREITYEITGKQKRRVYACGPVLRAIFNSDESEARPKEGST
jgi:Fic family protein